MYFKTATTGTDYKIGINKTEPKATLDIKGGIRISNNCESTVCDVDHAGMIVYVEASNN